MRGLTFYKFLINITVILILNCKILKMQKLPKSSKSIEKQNLILPQISPDKNRESLQKMNYASPGIDKMDKTITESESKKLINLLH